MADLTTTQVLSITPAELARGNAALVALPLAQADLAKAQASLTATQGTLASTQALLLASQGRVAELEALLAAATPPPPPPPPAGLGPLVIEGGKLRRQGMAAGDAVVLRVAEMSYGDSDVNFGADNLCQLIKSMGFNGLSPLFGQGFGDLAHMKALGDACLKAGLIYLPNGDHQTNGRAWLTNAQNVAYWNSLPNCIVRLEIEVDLPGSADFPPDSAYVSGALGLVTAYRAAGGTRIIQVGEYQGGRRVEHALHVGAQVVAGDPLHQTLLGWQAYWSDAGTWYQGCAGVANGLAGTRAALDAFSKLPVAGCLGLVWRNAEQKTTGALTLLDDCLAKGQSFMWWEATKDAIVDNNLLVDWELKVLSATGQAIKSKLLPVQRLYF